MFFRESSWGISRNRELYGDLSVLESMPRLFRVVNHFQGGELSGDGFITEISPVAPIIFTAQIFALVTPTSALLIK
jgi:hypothetical protein